MDATTGRLDTVEVVDEIEQDEESVEIEATKAQIEQTRAEMSGTIDAIKDRLSPQNLVQQAKETVKEATVGKAQQVAGNVVEGAKQAASSAVEGAERAMNSAGESAREAGTTVMQTIQQNPIPSALIGVGLGWLWMNSRKQTAETPRYGRSYLRNDWSRSSSGYHDSGFYAGTSSTASGRESEQSRASQIAGQVQEKAGEMGHRLQEKAGEMKYQAQAQTQRASAGFERLLEENPLAVGAMALTLGAALGMVIPETRQENQIMGEARDRVVEKAQQATQEVASKVQSVAQGAMDAATQTAKEETRAQGLSG